MQEAGFDGEPFDWIVCNSGADIWHALGKNGGGEAMWDADEQWDEHISHRRVSLPCRAPAACARLHQLPALPSLCLSLVARATGVRA